MRRVLQVVRDGQHVVQQPVHALPDLQQRLVRLDVDVAGAGLRRVAQDQVDELDDRRQLDVLGERRRIDQVVLAVGARLDLARRLGGVEHVVGRGARRASGYSRRRSCSSQVCVTTTATAFLPVRNSDVLQHRIVHRIGDRHPQHVRRRGRAAPTPRFWQNATGSSAATASATSGGSPSRTRDAAPRPWPRRRRIPRRDRGRPARAPASSSARLASRPRASPAASTRPARINRSPTNP